MNIMTETGKKEVDVILEFDFMDFDFFIHKTAYGAFAVSEKLSGHRICLLENDDVEEVKNYLHKYLIKNTVDKVKNCIGIAVDKCGKANE